MLEFRYLAHFNRSETSSRGSRDQIFLKPLCSLPLFKLIGHTHWSHSLFTLIVNTHCSHSLSTLIVHTHWLHWFAVTKQCASQFLELGWPKWKDLKRRSNWYVNSLNYDHFWWPACKQVCHTVQLATCACCCLFKATSTTSLRHSLSSALFWARVLCWWAQWTEHRVTFPKLQFGPLEHVDMTVNFGLIGNGQVTCQRRPVRWTWTRSQFHVYPWSKF